MNTRMFLAALAALAPSLLAAADSALDAVKILPASARESIMKISADNANPDPQTWYFIARNGYGEGTLRSITVQDGQVTSNKRSLDIRTLIDDSAPINLSQVRVDSDDAWGVAKRWVEKRGRRLASASFILQQKGRGAVPVWSVWCYGRDGGYIGRVDVLASTGDIVSSE